MNLMSWFRRHRHESEAPTDTPEAAETERTDQARQRELTEHERATRRIEQQLRALEYQQRFERSRRHS